MKTRTRQLRRITRRHYRQSDAEIKLGIRRLTRGRRLP